MARLEPGAYWLVVDGASAADHGEFTLQPELDPELGDCGPQPANQACDTATPLAAVAFHSLLLDTSWEPPEKEGDVTLYSAAARGSGWQAAVKGCEGGTGFQAPQTRPCAAPYHFYVASGK